MEKNLHSMHGISLISISPKKSLPLRAGSDACSSSSEFRTNHSCSYGHVQRFRRFPLRWIIGDIEALIHKFSYRIAHTVSFITHHDKPMRGQFFSIHIVTVQEGAINGHIFQGSDQGGQMAIMNLHTCHRHPPCLANRRYARCQTSPPNG